ncbi:stage III sporulation protein AG [Thermincola ferriacetica]
MGNKFFDQLISFFGRNERKDGADKKTNKFNLFIIIGAFGLMLIVLANNFGQQKPQVKITADSGSGSSGQRAEQHISSGTDITDAENAISEKLAEILSQIDGAGEVKATVNLASTMEYEYAVNTSTSNKTTQETDQKGGNRTVTELNDDGQLVLIREGEGNKEIPVVKKEIKPQVQGVVVVAEGANDPEIKARLLDAVQVFLNVSPHRVVVLPKESR